MRLSPYIALRYLFSKKKHNAINIVSMICACGVCLGTIALVCVLSVYNGFQDLIGGLCSTFDPEIKVSLVKGKTFDKNEIGIKKTKQLHFIENCSDVLEDNVMIKNDDRQTTATLKGVDESYNQILDVKKILITGVFSLDTGKVSYGIMGVALASKLNASIYMVKSMSVYAPRHDAHISMGNPEAAFNTLNIVPSGVYSVEQEEADGKYLFVDLDLAREIFGYDNNQCSAIEIRLKKGADVEEAKAEIKNLVGERFKVQDKKEQHEDFYKMLRVEKWITFLILAFILLIAVINTVGSLTLLIIEKKHDINILRSLGATPQQVKRIFLYEGWMISGLGTLAGLLIGIILCLIQQQFGLIKLGGGDGGQNYIVDYYPVNMEVTDLLLIAATVSLLGLIAAWFPSHNLKTDEISKVED